MDIDKEVLVNTIKEWLQADNDLREIQKAAKEYRTKKKELTDQLVVIMRENEIDNFDVKDGVLMYKYNKVKAPLNKKHLLNTLTHFFKNDSSQATELTKFILDTREDKVKETIQRKKFK